MCIHIPCNKAPPPDYRHPPPMFSKGKPKKYFAKIPQNPRYVLPPKGFTWNSAKLHYAKKKSILGDLAANKPQV